MSASGSSWRHDRALLGSMELLRVPCARSRGMCTESVRIAAISRLSIYSQNEVRLQLRTYFDVETEPQTSSLLAPVRAYARCASIAHD